MVNKRGYSWGPDKPYYAEERSDGWAVFDARDDEDKATGLKQWETFDMASKLNHCGRVDIDSIDSTP